MCGICGSSADPAGAAVAAMKSAMEHRGPDDDGTYLDRGTGFALGAQRLSIIDTERGHQPIGNEDGTVWAVLNGEIYNHPALLERLRRSGHRLETSCDTEALVHLYEEFGDALVHALEGMFAFAIWDVRRRRLLIGRDRFGEKPLFYAEPAPGSLYFASELRALIASGSVPFHLDLEAVDRFFAFGYPPGPGSMVKGVRQLPPACTLSWSLGDPNVTVRKYWSPPALSSPCSIPMKEAVGETRELLERAVQSRMIADVPLGVFLSGGVDSTLIAAIAARLSPGSVKTFSVGYGSAAVDETAMAAATARELGTDHRELLLGGDDVANAASHVLGAIDQPVADPALIALHALSGFARGYVKVAVGGEGADELFGGYPRYRWLVRSERLAKTGSLPIAATRALERLPAGVRARRLATVLRPASTTDRHLEWVSAGRYNIRARLYGAAMQVADLSYGLETFVPNEGSDAATRHMVLDQQHWLVDDVLAKADRASMLASLEMRTPYLDRYLAEFAATVPANVHLGDGGKALLRAVLRKELPAPSRRRRKRAFAVPLGEWLRGPLKPLLDSQVEGSSLFDAGIFDPTAICSLAVDHQRGARDTSAVLWPFLCLSTWLNSWNGRNGR